MCLLPQAACESLRMEAASSAQQAAAEAHAAALESQRLRADAAAAHGCARAELQDRCIM